MVCSVPTTGNRVGTVGTAPYSVGCSFLANRLQKVGL
ncbi:hypothetical protein BMETH_3376_0 [methanotrophic bacterial endosymbiont of Bathymodiolus sp.]|nr:hypothetical protein BMETH_3376_0 [methanotrophic bacterial endosymbiont of Bathymodiolus sp.]